LLPFGAGGGGGGGDAFGGAIYGGGLLVNDTLVGNSVTGGQGGAGGAGTGQAGANGRGFGGGIVGLGGGINIRNCILANNSADLDRNFDDLAAAGGNQPSLGHNLFTDTQGFNAAASDRTVADPMLAPLGNYGGPTQTMRPLLGSPAIG
jgi:hypothetical protein